MDRRSRSWRGMVVWGLLCAGAAIAQESTVRVMGTVRDRAGAPVAGAVVRLHEAAAGVEVQAVTDQQGEFVLPAVERGDASVTAVLQTATAREDVPGRKLSERLALVLRPQARPDGNAGAEMEFSDAPKFTVAAVTDWTAVGGHGSDATLRASESMASNVAELHGRDAGAMTDGERRVVDEVQKDEALQAWAKAQIAVRAALRDHPTAMLYRLSGEVDEAAGDPLAAVGEFAQAAKLDSSEANEFEWGSELLVHRAIWQAEAVFERGVEQYPTSERMQMALGAALFAGARYEQAAERLCKASDLAPEDAKPYEAMGKAQMAAPDALACVEPHLARFVQMKPESSEAHYLLAMAMLKRQGDATNADIATQAEAQLKKAVQLDARCGEGYLELGVLAAQRNDLTAAMGFYSKAIEADPTLGDAYYRLAKAYERTGQKEKAKEAFAMHETVTREQAATTEQQRKQVKQFLFAKPGDAPTAATP